MLAIDRIAIPEQVLRWTIPGESLDDLLSWIASSSTSGVLPHGNVTPAQLSLFDCFAMKAGAVEYLGNRSLARFNRHAFTRR